MQDHEEEEEEEEEEASPKLTSLNITFFVAVVHAEATLVHIRAFLVREFLLRTDPLLSRAEKSSRHAAPLRRILSWNLRYFMILRRRVIKALGVSRNPLHATTL